MKVKPMTRMLRRLALVGATFAFLAAAGVARYFDVWWLGLGFSAVGAVLAATWLTLDDVIPGLRRRRRR